MKTYFLKTYFLLLITFFFSCQKSEKKTSFHKLENMNWLIGQWEYKIEDNNLSEIWEKKNDSTFVGQSYFIKENDTLHSEHIKLIQKGKDLFYIPTVKGQNKDKPVVFKLTKSTENEFTFENLTHDYPNKIVYKMVTVTSLLATISGKQQGKLSFESYSMDKK